MTPAEFKKQGLALIFPSSFLWENSSSVIQDHFAKLSQENAMIEPLIAVGFAFFLFTKGFFDKPEEVSVEKKLGDALIKYLEEGIRVRH